MTTKSAQEERGYPSYQGYGELDSYKWAQIYKKKLLRGYVGICFRPRNTRVRAMNIQAKLRHKDGILIRFGEAMIDIDVFGNRGILSMDISASSEA